MVPNARYVGEIKNGLDRVSVVMSIHLPRFKDLHLNLIQSRNCFLDFMSGSGSLEDNPSVAIRKCCAKEVPYIEHFKKKEKYYMERLHGLLEEDLDPALSELKQHVITRSRYRSHRALVCFYLPFQA